MTQSLLIATRKGLFRISKNTTGSAKWHIADAEFLGDNLSIAMQDKRSGSLYAAFDYGHFGVKMKRAKGLGQVWEETPVPTYPEKPEGVKDLDQWGREMQWSTARVWALETGGPQQSGVLWCGTLPGGLFRSTDHGESWDFMRTLWDHPMRKEWLGGGADLPGIHSICVDPRNSDHVRIGISTGGVWKTEDSGKSWACIGQGMRAAYMPPEQQFNPNAQDVHRLVQCPGAPDRLWVQHHNGIFYSQDGGQNWDEAQNVSPSSFGFTVVVHPKNPDMAWFVPGVSDERRIPPSGQLVVTRTTDGGKTFESFRQGLPQHHAYDIVFRHCLDISDDGNILAFGTTTGGFWISEDQGESWQSVAQNLPPVYSVRFIEG